MKSKNRKRWYESSVEYRSRVFYGHPPEFFLTRTGTVISVLTFFAVMIALGTGLYFIKP
jgi:hypothetical protein